jgi:hypothetical protein
MGVPPGEVKYCILQVFTSAAGAGVGEGAGVGPGDGAGEGAGDGAGAGDGVGASPAQPAANGTAKITAKLMAPSNFNRFCFFKFVSYHINLLSTLHILTYFIFFTSLSVCYIYRIHVHSILTLYFLIYIERDHANQSD